MSIQSSDNNKRIAKNTLLFYFQMLFMMVVVNVQEPSHIECVGRGKLLNCPDISYEKINKTNLWQ